MAGFKSGERPWCLEIAGGDIPIEIPEELDEGVGISLRMSCGIRRVATSLRAHERGIFDQPAIRLFAAANPQCVRLLCVPRQRTFRAINLKPQPVLPSCTHLRYRQHAAQVTFKVQQNRTIDRKSTRLNSSHANISYAVFCLKKQKH